MADYVCKDPTCTETVSEHLVNGDLDCIGDNREAVAAYAKAAEELKEAVAVTVSNAEGLLSLASALATYEAAN